MTHPYVLSQEGLLCFAAQSQEHGGEAIIWGELDRAIEGQQPSRTGICSFVQGGTEGALPEPYKMTSSGLLVCTFLIKLSETESMRVAWGPDVLSWDLCSQASTVQLDWHLPENTTIGWFAIGAPFTSQMRAGLQLAQETDVKSMETVANVMLPATSSSMTVFWRWVSYGLGRHILGGSHKPPCASQRYRDEILRPIVRPYAGAVGLGFPLLQDNARPHVARVCRKFLNDKGIDAMTGPHIPQTWIQLRTSGMLCIRHQVALQTVQELTAT